MQDRAVFFAFPSEEIATTFAGRFGVKVLRVFQGPPRQALGAAVEFALSEEKGGIVWWPNRVPPELAAVVVETGRWLLTSSLDSRKPEDLAALKLMVQEVDVPAKAPGVLLPPSAEGAFLGGQPPFGWRRSDSGGLEADPHEQEVIELIRKLRQMGQQTPTILAKLEEGGYRNRSGAPISGRTYYRILKNNHL